MAQSPRTGDLTTGPMLKKIILFSLPLAASSILQLLFNAADVVVIGRFVGSTALAAVGSNGALINLLVNLFVGLSLGANVVAARCFGAKDERGVQNTVQTSVTLGLVSGVLLAVSFGDLRTEPVYLFFACMMAATVMEWITAKLLERLHRRKWWDYSGKKFNLNGYVCLQYSLLWGALGTASVLWGNDVLLRLCAHIPVWLLRPAVWISLTVAVLDQIGSAVLVQQYAARHPMLEQLNQRLGERSDTLRRRIALYIEKRIQYAYPAAARQEQTALRKGEKNFLSVSDLLWLFVIGAFLGDMVETVFCRVTAGVWMSRSSLVWGPFSVVWGLALVMAAVLLRGSEERSDRSIFLFGFVMGGAYEYICSAVGELLFGVIFWDYSGFKFNLGGRVNLLYCFFWGIAAVVWIRYGYPLVAKLMANLKKHILPWMTVVLTVFMAVNMGLSALALARYDARTSGIAPANQLDVFLDEHFDNARMERVYPNAKKTG